MDNIKENKVINFKGTKNAMHRDGYVTHSVGDDKTSYQGNQKDSVISMGAGNSQSIEKLTGFFIVLTERTGINAVSGIRGKYWQADLIDPMKGWQKTQGESIEENMQLQRDIYNARLKAQQSVPELINAECSPMASGKTVRFVEVSSR